eukprot:scaffold76281_cov61-Attheya_sp.AAC.5
MKAHILLIHTISQFSAEAIIPMKSMAMASAHIFMFCSRRLTYFSSKDRWFKMQKAVANSGISIGIGYGYDYAK